VFVSSKNMDDSNKTARIVLWPPLALVLAAGCGAVEKSAAQRFEIESRQLSFPLLSGAEGGAGRKGRFLLGAGQVLWIVPGRLRADVSTALVQENEGGGESVSRFSSRQIFDFERREVWSAEGDGRFTLRRLDELEYERRNLSRRAWIDFVDLYIRFPEVRAQEQIGLYRGDLALEREGPRADGRLLLKVAAEPGVLWQIAVASGGEAPEPWIGEMLIFWALEQTAERARKIARSFDGLPVRFTAKLLPAGGEHRVVVEHEVLSVQRKEPPPGHLEPPPADIEAARRLDAELRSVPALLEALAGKQPPAEVGVVGLVLRLEPLLGAGDLPRLEEAWAAAADSRLQVELLRLVLRIDREASGPLLRRALQGSSGVAALSAAEALIAEGDSGALQAVLDLLKRRRQLTNVSQESVAIWAVQHLRVLSGLPLEDLAGLLGPLWSPAEAAGAGMDPLEPLAAEVDHWLRWWERRGP
jgi:hypothetical protein